MLEKLNAQLVLWVSVSKVGGGGRGGGKAGAVTAVKMIVVLVGPYFNFYTV